MKISALRSGKAQTANSITEKLKSSREHGRFPKRHIGNYMQSRKMLKNSTSDHTCADEILVTDKCIIQSIL